MSELLIDKADGILTLTLNRPEKKNALNMEMYQGLRDGLIQAGEDADIRVVYIRSSSEDFTGGNDLKDFAAVNRGEMDLADLPVVPFIRTVIEFPKPLVAAVRGVAVGIGTTLLLHCDAVVAGRSARFHLPFVQLGLTPELGSSFLFPELAGRIRGSYLLLSGEPFDAEAAYQMGLISHLCEDADVETTAAAVCRRLAGLPPNTVQAIKQLVRSSRWVEHLKTVIEEENRVFSRCLKSPEHRQALEAFFNKR